MDINDTRIPVTLLTGFLGAGKTTLLNHLIKDQDAGRIAVIMNEFGAAGLDHDLIEEATEETILMQSGCLCCTFRGDISKTLSSLISRRQAGELSFNRVVIETTGIAEPGPILQTLAGDPIIVSDYYMDGVVTLVDAATGPNTIDAHAEAVNQIAMADLIVVTKSDLVTPIDLEWFEARVSAINSAASRIRADKGSVPVGSLFGLSAMCEKATSSEISKWIGSTHSEADASAGFSGNTEESMMGTIPTPNGVKPQVRHDHQISSISLEFEDPIPPSIFDFWLDALIALKGPDILRMKGIVHVEGMDCPIVFHVVQHIFDTPVPLKSWNSEDTTSKIAVIARNTSKEELSKSLEVLSIKPKGSAIPTEYMMAQAVDVPF